MAGETGMLGGLAGSRSVARPRSRWAAAVFGLSAVALGACGGSEPIARAYGSTELLPIRDSTLYLSGQYDGNFLVYGTGGVGQVPPAWWTLDLTTGAVQSYGTNMPPPYSPPTGTMTTTPPPPSLFTCNLNPSGTLQITDNTTGVETDVHDVTDVVTCPGADGILTVLAIDASGGDIIESGPYDQLMPVDSTITILESFSLDTSTSPPTTIVLAAPVTAPDQHEIDSIDLSTFDVTTLVPAVPVSPAWAIGATPVGTLQSTGLAGADIVTRYYDHYFYLRSMSDGGTTLFVGPIATGPASELALFEIPAGTPLPMSARLGYTLQGYPKHAVLSWQFDGAAGAASNVVLWDDTDMVLTACPWSSALAFQDLWASDESHVLFEVTQPELSFTPSAGPLVLLTLGGPAGASCQQLIDSGVVSAGFSPDAQFMFWVIQPPGAQAQVWIAASDGSGARMLPSGEITDVHFIDDGDGGARLEMTLGGELDWMDLHDATGMLHHVAEQVHGAIFDIIGGHWLIMGYRLNATDGTVTLALINRDNGQVRPISPSVVAYEVVPQHLGADGGVVSPFGDAGASRVFDVVYVVRGRNPSPQDGIWRATITEADLQ
jgi:hypothetical protein